MTRRVYRYDKPEKEVLLDILNHTNKTRFESIQLSFRDLVRVDAALGCRVTIVPEAWTGWTQSEFFFYDRLDLQDTFKNCPLVVDVVSIDQTTILEALKEQCNVWFDADKVSITAAPRPLSVVFANVNLNTLQAPTVDQEEPVQPTQPEEIDFVLSTAPDSLIWFGQIKVLVRPSGFLLGESVSKRLNLRKWFHETLSEKVAVELAIPKTIDGTPHSTFLSSMKVGDYINETSMFPGVARSLTKDEWVSVVDQVSDFNLYGAKIIYNGVNTNNFFTGQSRLSRVLAVELSDSCRNLEGVWLIAYSDKEAYRHCSPRIAHDHTLLIDQ